MKRNFFATRHNYVPVCLSSVKLYNMLYALCSYVTKLVGLGLAACTRKAKKKLSLLILVRRPPKNAENKKLAIANQKTARNSLSISITAIIRSCVSALYNVCATCHTAINCFRPTLFYYVESFFVCPDRKEKNSYAGLFVHVCCNERSNFCCYQNTRDALCLSAASSTIINSTSKIGLLLLCGKKQCASCWSIQTTRNERTVAKLHIFWWLVIRIQAHI